eukprot:403361395
MEVFTQHKLFQILKGGNTTQPTTTSQQQSLDVKACYQNIPLFIRCITQYKTPQYTIDEAYLTALRSLIQDQTSGTDLRKQWLGYFLISISLDSKYCLINDISLFNKYCNTFLAQITNTVNKNELGMGNDIFAIAIKAWLTVTQRIYQNYDPKNHASALTAIKQIAQVMIKKVDKSLKVIAEKQAKSVSGGLPYIVDQDDKMQIRMALSAILKITQMFPSTLKNIVSSKLSGGQGNQGSFQKDHLTTQFELLIKQLLTIDITSADYCVQLLCLLFKSKDKSRLQFKDWISRILTNIVMYVNALQPRQFEDSQGANQEINMSVGFEFLFERDDASQINKLSVKDLKDQISNIGKVEQNIAILFKMLQLSFQTQRRAQQFSGEGINFIQVEVNFFDIILTLESILLKQTGLKQQKQKTSQICGLPQNQYEKMIELVKDKSLDFIVILSKQMPAETLPYIPRMIAYINLTFQNKVKNGLKLDAYQHILRVLEQIAQVYGANLSQLVNSICFADNDYNINDLICEIFKLIVQKTDQTSIDLSDKSSTQKDLIKPNKMQRKDDNSSTPVIKTFQLQYLDSYTLEQNLISLLDFIISITQHSSLYMLLVQNEKVKLESVLFTILSFSQLKYQNINHDVKMKILELTKNVILIRSSKQIQSNDLLGCLVSYRNNIQHFQGEHPLVIAKVNEVITMMDPLFVPRKDKYQLQTNTQQHFQNEHKSMFIQYNKEILSRSIYHLQNPEQSTIPTQQQALQTAHQQSANNHQEEVKENQFQNPSKIDYINDESQQDPAVELIKPSTTPKAFQSKLKPPSVLKTPLNKNEVKGNDSESDVEAGNDANEDEEKLDLPMIFDEESE